MINDHKRTLPRIDRKDCLQCNRTFKRADTKYKPKQFELVKYCSTVCFSNSLRKPRPECICLGCGKVIDTTKVTYERAVNRKFCGAKCRTRQYNPRWCGGRYTNSEGYIVVLRNNRRTPEHRIVMEQALGRKLLRSEVIHHRDGNKSNNALTNLEVMSNSTHKAWHNTMSARYAWENYGPAALDPMRMVGGC